MKVAHRTSILPPVLGGEGHAVMPSTWAVLDNRSGLGTVMIEPVFRPEVALLSSETKPTLAAGSFLAAAANQHAAHG
ncbi:hypothetical protein IWX64_002559 [Arthrobacter sp. CAN_A212]|uniref:hypothetical protein n=1 Tax=Arthrobacter sp. CAN_A212 TaxID=2787719 RepID=UPI0018C8E9F1